MGSKSKFIFAIHPFFDQFINNYPQVQPLVRWRVPVLSQCRHHPYCGRLRLQMPHQHLSCTCIRVGGCNCHVSTCIRVGGCNYGINVDSIHGDYYKARKCTKMYGKSFLIVWKSEITYFCRSCPRGRQFDTIFLGSSTELEY